MPPDSDSAKPDRDTLQDLPVADSMPTAVIVLGMHRSGTSAITGTLGLLGSRMPFDPLLPVASANATGYFESASIVSAHDQLLDEIGLRWDMPMLHAIGNGNILKQISRASSVSKWTSKLAACTHRAFDSHSPSAPPIVIKDPRMCRLVPLWKRVLDELGYRPRVVLPVRNPVEIAASLAKRDGLETGRSLWIWLDHVLRAEYETRDLTRVFVRYSCLLSEWRATMARVDHRLGLGLQIDECGDKVDSFLSTEHRHHTADEAELQELPRMVTAAFAEFDTAAAQEREPNPDILDEIAREFDDMCRLSGSWITSTQQDIKQAGVVTRRLTRELKSAISIHEDEKENSDAVKHQLRCEIDSRGNEIKQLESNLLNQTKELHAKSKNLIDAQREHAATQRELVDSRRELSGTHQELADTQRELAESHREHQDTQRELAAISRKSELSQATNTKLGAKLKASQSVIRQERATHAKLDRALESLQSVQSESLARIEKLEKDSVSASETKASLESEIAKIRTTLNEEHAQRVGVENTLIEVKLERTRAASQARVLEAELAGVLSRGPAAFVLRKLRASQHAEPTRSQILGRRAAFMLRMLRLTVSRRDGLKRLHEIRALMRDPDFDLVWYRDTHRDVLTSGLHPAEHFVLFGSAEGRPPRSPDAETAQESPLKEPSQRLIDCARRTTQSSKETFSIVMPTWNRKSVISRAIDSVLSQSFERWQLIIADDGSTDGTERYLRDRYAEHFESGKFLFLPAKHAGVSAARNRAIEAATGDWIAYLDSDNAWHKHYLLITAAGYMQDGSLRTAYASIFVHDRAHSRKFIRASQFDWPKLARQNYIDLNIFSHQCSLYQELGGFDESLTRLVDWDLILRYTRQHPPKFNRPVLANYFIDKRLSNISLTEPLEANKRLIDHRTLWDRIRTGSEPLRLAYVLWDFPALSQTFVLREIRWMIEQGIDVKVYFKADPDKATTLDFEVESYRVKDHRELARLLTKHDRNWAHTHFLYPAATLLLWPACEKAGVPFSVMPHAVDIFHHDNRKRNAAADIGKSELCKRFVVYGEHHRDFLIRQGVPANKFMFSLQASDAGRLAQRGPRPAHQRGKHEPMRVVSIGRFIEKKGFADLLGALKLIREQSSTLIELTLFGYGPLEPQLRAFCKEHGLGNVHFKETFEGAKGLQDAFEHADLFCLPCVEADNGDVDGFPTVFIEAAWYGLPILTTTVSAIPDYFSDGHTAALVPPRDPAALAARLQKFAQASTQDRAAMSERAHTWAAKNTGPNRTGERLLDLMARPPLDIFMVTYHPEGLENWPATDRAITSVLENTTTPFRLTIVDNASDPAARTKLRELVAQHPSTVRLIPLNENIGCGPASNIALSHAQSDIVVYVCSNEGYAMRVGWERALLETMRDHPEAALGGQLIHSPAWATGETLQLHESFSKFRNPDFAQDNPERTFRHIQGGLWAMRRSVFQAAGGFNPCIPQSGMDVEYSYFLESHGHALLDIPEVLCLSNKTRPTISAQLDETTAIAHPVFEADMKIVKACADPDARRCNLCDWLGTAADVASQPRPHEFDCPNCNATSTDRAAWQWLARSEMCHRDLTLGVVSPKGKPVLTERFFKAAQSVRVRLVHTKSLNDPKIARCDMLLDPTGAQGPLIGFQSQAISHCSQMLGIGSQPLRALKPSPHTIDLSPKAIRQPTNREAPKPVLLAAESEI